MSMTGNKMVSYKGKILGGAGPRDTTMGADLGLNATNKKATWGPSPKEASCSSTSQSRNRMGPDKSYEGSSSDKDAGDY